MKRFHYHIATFFFVCLIVTQAAPAQNSHPMARFLDTNTIGFARIDLESFTPETIHKKFKSIAEQNQQFATTAKNMADSATQISAELKQAGAAEVFAFVSLSDLRSGFFLVVPAIDDQVEAVQNALSKNISLPTHRVHRIAEGVLFSSDHTALRLAEGFLPTRRDASEILEMANGTIDLIIAPSRDHFHAMRDSIAPPFPRFAGLIFTKGGITGDLLADGMQRSHLMFDNASMRLRLDCVGVQSAPSGHSDKLNASAKLAAKAQWALEQIGSGTIPAWPRAQSLGELPKQLTNTVSQVKISHTGNQFSVSLSEKQIMNLSEGLMTFLGDDISESIAIADQLNTARTLALAIHNYYDAYGKFPTNITNAEGQPLLSWRVAILPFMEELEIYNRFRLDEPWNSKHNKPLLEAIPKFLKTELNLSAAGKTIWSRPRGERFMSNCQGFQNLSDGSSNTVMVIGTTPEAAVYWSEPDDFAPDLEDIKNGVFSETQSTAVVARADGSSSVISDQISEKTLKLFLMFNDGEVLDPASIK